MQANETRNYILLYLNFICFLRYVYARKNIRTIRRLQLYVSYARSGAETHIILALDERIDEFADLVKLRYGLEELGDPSAVTEASPIYIVYIFDMDSFTSLRNHRKTQS